MSMPISESYSDYLFSQLPADLRQRFYAEASGSELSGSEWFYHSVPNDLKTDPEGLDILLNGGEVTTADGVTHTIDAHEFSRIQSGANGGEYTPDNVILESEVANGARGGENMDVFEQVTAEADLTEATELIASRSTDAVDAVTATTDGLEVLDVVDGVLGVAAPLGVGIRTAQTIYDAADGTHEEKLIAAGTIGGGAALGTAAVIAAFPPAGLFIAGVGILSWIGSAANSQEA